MEFAHITVLLDELVESLNLNDGDSAADCTAGGGGHTAAMINRVGPTGTVYAFDRDSSAVAWLTNKFKNELNSGSLTLHHSNFARISEHISEGSLAGIGMDLGVSSPQIDQAERGFSFNLDGPLDMRMSPESQGETAADVVNNYSQLELEKIFFQLGEEPKSRYVAAAIVERRKTKEFTRTKELAELVKSSIFYKKESRKHPATKVFQALRLWVNQELSELDQALNSAFKLLAPGGRLGVITFHSLEDRIVKQCFKKLAGKSQKNQFPRDLPVMQETVDAMTQVQGKIIKPFPAVPKEEEIRSNPRSRSAKLRVIEKV